MDKLPNAPLKEVIFEVRWNLDFDGETHQEYDAGYDFALGKFQSSIKDKFPIYKRKIPKGVPDSLLNYQPVNQFWTNENIWPVIQLGPGLLSVNDTDKNYVWKESYYPLVKNTLSKLFTAYNDTIPINYCSLRYIDSINIKEYQEDNNILKLMDEKLKVFVNLKFEQLGILENINLNLMNKLEDDTVMNLNFYNGIDTTSNNPVFNWETTIFKQHNFKENEEILSWLDSNHLKISGLFKEITKGELYDRFK